MNKLPRDVHAVHHGGLRILFCHRGGMTEILRPIRHLAVSDARNIGQHADIDRKHLGTRDARHAADARFSVQDIARHDRRHIAARLRHALRDNTVVRAHDDRAFPIVAPQFCHAGKTHKHILDPSHAFKGLATWSRCTRAARIRSSDAGFIISHMLSSSVFIIFLRRKKINGILRLHEPVPAELFRP